MKKAYLHALSVIFLASLYLIIGGQGTCELAPKIDGIDPGAAEVGTSVVISGSGFGASQGTSTVTFNGVDAGVVPAWSDTSITVPVPQGASSGPVVVTVGSEVSNAVDFIVLPYAIGHTSVTYVDPERNDRQILTEIYYPADAGGDDIPVALPVGDGFPVVAFGHGRRMTWMANENIWSALVPEGYIVALPRTEMGIWPDHENFGLDLAFSIRSIQEEGADPASMFHEKVGATSAIMGHSMGAVAGFYGILGDDSVTALCTLAAGQPPLELLPGITVPALVFAGSDDYLTTPEDIQIPIYQALGSECKTIVTVTGGNHCQFVEPNTYCDDMEAGYPPPGIDRDTQHAVTNRFLVPWLDAILKDYTDAWAAFEALLETSEEATSMHDCGPIECPPNFIAVPANPALGVYEDFCIAKYEMKIQGDDNGDQPYDPSFTAESRASGTPWKNLNLDLAIEECEALGDGYAIPTNEEWMTITQNIESVATNWSDGIAHPSGFTAAQINIGHSCRWDNYCRANQEAFFGEGFAASDDDNDACFGFIDYGSDPAPTCSATEWNLYRRTHVLSNGEVIWDFSGNVWNWIDWYVPTGRARTPGSAPDDWMEVNEAAPTAMMEEDDYKSVNRVLNSTDNRIGRYHPGVEDGTNGSAMRGGNFMHGYSDNGIYALGMGYGPSTPPEDIVCRVGFRCVWRSAE